MAIFGLLVTVAILLLGVAIFMYFFLYKEKKEGTVFLYEKVGKYEKFKGVYPLFIVRGSSTDVYKIGGMVNKTIDKPAPEDFFDSNTNYGKVIHVTKFSDDDFRVKKRFDESWYRSVEVEYEEPTGEYIPDPETGEDIPEMIKKTKFVKENYNEPLGITQEGRDAIRAGLENERALKAEMQDNTFWDKFGQPLMIVVVVFILGMTTMMTSKENTKAIEATAQVCNSNYEKQVEQVNSPAWLENYINDKEQENINDNAPPN